MDAEFHKPTYEFSNGAFNATQVRLYGLAPKDNSIFVNGTEYTVTLELAKKSDDNGDTAKRGRGQGTGGSVDFTVKSFLMLESGELMGNNLFVGSGTIDIGSSKHPPAQKFTAGIIFGYAFEGHCYDLPKPKFMLLPVEPRDIPPGDCGYTEKAAAGYKVWVVDKLQKCVEFEVNQGFVEQLVLDANMPGQRSPSTYRATMALSHRGGRLT